MGGGVEEGDDEEEKGAGVREGEGRKDAHQGGKTISETKG